MIVFDDNNVTHKRKELMLLQAKSANGANTSNAIIEDFSETLED